MNLTEIKERLLEYKEATKDTDRPIPKFVRMCQMDKQLSENMKSELSFISDYYKKRVTLSIYIYFVLNDILTLEDVPKCDMCGKVRGFEDYSNGFRLTCGSRKCYQRHPDIIAKKHATSMERFGSLKAAYVDTAKKTIQKKYGVDNVSQSEEIKQKKIDTSRERYGTDYPWQTKEGKCAQKRGVFEKYGVDNISQLDSIKKQKELTSLKNWNVRNPSQYPVIRKRILDINGVSYKFPSGKTVLIDGSESITIDYLLESGYLESDIKTQPNIRIKYYMGNLDHYWFPDISLNVSGKLYVVEVKLLDFITTYDNLSYKLTCGKRRGYNTKCIVSDLQRDSIFELDFVDHNIYVYRAKGSLKKTSALINFLDILKDKIGYNTIIKGTSPLIKP